VSDFRWFDVPGFWAGVRAGEGRSSNELEGQVSRGLAKVTELEIARFGIMVLADGVFAF